MSLPLPAGDFAAYLFDCDGTVADSMPLHYRAWSRALAEHGCAFPEDQFYAWGGMPVPDIIRTLNAQHGLTMPVEETGRRKEELYYTLLPELTAVPEVKLHVEAGYGRLPMAVVSGSDRESVTASLTTIGLLDRFDVLVCAGEYERPKPDPEAFLRAAAQLGVPARECLVFEDTDMGIEAATSAGMTSVRVPPPGRR